MKKFGLIAVAAVAALVLGTAVFGGGQSVQAETTDVVNVHCEIIDSYVAGACTNHLDEGDIQDLADDLGDEDGTLEASDLESGAIEEGWDASQLSEDCVDGDDFLGGSWGCTMLIFVFVDDEKPVQIDLDSGLTTLQTDDVFGDTATDYLCDTDADDAGESFGYDNDCDDVYDATNGDGVVVFHVVSYNAERGDDKDVNVTQEAVEQTTVLTMVGIPDDIALTLLEDTIGSNGSTAAAEDCADDVDLNDANAAPNATVAIVTLEDQDNTPLAMWPLAISVQPPADDPTIATLGIGTEDEDIVGDTLVTIQPSDEDLPISYYRVICGGRSTGETTIEVESYTDGSTEVADLTVVGLPDAQTLTAAPATIMCDGTQTSTVSAKVVDSAGNNVANGTEVTFTVVALGTANPINTTTQDGVATSVITPLSNSSAGVTVIVTSGDVQTSTLVNCSLPLVTQPTLTPPGSGGTITPPDTGNGGYLAQDGSGISTMTMVALALAGAVVAAGGLVARRSVK